MLILDIPRRSPSHFSYIDVPLYHRVHLALAEDVPVHGCLLAGMNPPNLPELVISPFDFERWDRLWRLSASLYDAVGLFHTVTDTIKGYGGNILAAESGMMEEQHVYHIEMIFDLDDREDVEKLEWSLQTKLFDESVVHPSGNCRLKIRRLHNLWLAKRAYDRQRRSSALFRPISGELDFQILERKSARPCSKVFRFSLPPNMRTILRERVSQQVDDRLDEGFYLRLSDTKDRFLRVLFFKKTDPVIHARLEYKDRVGAAADVTKALSLSGFNILAAYLSPAAGKNRGRCEFVVRCQRLSGRPTSELKEDFEGVLRLSPLVRDMQLDVSYPRDYAEQPIIKRLTVPADLPEAEQDGANSIGSLKKKMEAHLHALHRRLDDGTGSEEDVRKWWFVNRLQRRYEKLWPVVEISNRKSLFVSCHYQGKQLEIVKTQAATRGFNVFTGEDLVRDPNITQGLLTRIKLCTHFVGVWSDHGAQQCGETYLPSPWLLWEFGVAEAFGLVWRLLISNKISDSVWKRMAPNVANSFFDDDFESKIERVLDVLASLRAARLPWQEFDDLKPTLSSSAD